MNRAINNLETPSSLSFLKFLLIDSLKLRLVKISKIKKCLIGRNDLCFCGSGKKFKKCHGK